MTDDFDHLIPRLIAGDETAPMAILDRAATCSFPDVLVAAALLAAEPNDFLARAAVAATTTRDRQLVAIAAAHRSGDADLVAALVSDHLADHPDNVLAAWVAAHPIRPARPAAIHY